MLDVDALLDRIGYRDGLAVGADTLEGLANAFLLAVPFENLDIHFGGGISLDPQVIARKIVALRRGGLCYENNSLFARLLEALGFSVTLCSAQMMKNGVLSPPFDHLALVVDLGGRPFLADVGNGDSARSPMPLAGGAATRTPERVAYRIRPRGDRFTLQFRPPEGADWQTRFVLDPRPRTLPEFAERCRFHQSSPDSVFTSQPLATLALTDGRRTLAGRRLKTMRAGLPAVEEEIADEHAYASCLAERFGIRLDPAPAAA